VSGAPVRKREGIALQPRAVDDHSGGSLALPRSQAGLLARAQLLGALVFIGSHVSANASSGRQRRR
jgi:hypothetical protein